VSYYVLDEHHLPIRAYEDIFRVRDRIRAMAHASGFNAFAALAVTTAASELARNTWVHGRGGLVHLERIADVERHGVRATFRDHGPGIQDLSRALAGGHSTAGSLGLGLSGSRRLVDEFAIDTHPARGTVVTIAKWGRRGRR
jgi:serine/threonine-protein kinase RsbT